MDLSVMKTLFSMKQYFKAKKIFSKIYCELLLLANFTKLWVSLRWTQNLVFIHKQIFLRSFDSKILQILHVWAKTPDWPLWPKSSEKKEDFEIKSDLFWQNPFLKLWKLKFIIIQFGSIRFWSIFLCFCVRYKVFSVYCTLSRPTKYIVNEEYFNIKSKSKYKQF